MSEIKAENRGFFRATICLRALFQLGLRHIVISPGSRSTPLTLAAAALPVLQKHVILDERSAAFMALGIGKATGLPAALVCTSGTAVANYYPAVIEARKSGVPLLLLTADRPPRLHHTGANQTINQQNIFGNFPVFYHNMGEVQRKFDLENDKRLATQAYHQSISRRGPAHLNFPFSKPLEPGQNFLQTITDENLNLPSLSAVNYPQDQSKSFRFDDDILHDLHATDRPLIIIGQLAPGIHLQHLFLLAEKLEAPVLSEQGLTDLTYAVQGFEGFLRRDENLNALEPDLILRFGREPASKSLLQAIKSWQPTRHIYFCDTKQYSDIERSTTDFIEWNGKYFGPNKFTEKSGSWLNQWKDAEAGYFRDVHSIFSKEENLTDALVYHHISPNIPEDWAVIFSNSFPARDHSMFGHWGKQKIFTQRGVSGIDGITSAAMGVTIGRNQANILFTGDLAFLHDTNALLNHTELAKTLVVIIINNRGGSIFRMLPVVKQKRFFERYFETPQQVDIKHLSESYGIHYRCIETVKQLKKLDLETFESREESKMHIVECKTNAHASMKIRNTLWGRISED